MKFTRLSLAATFATVAFAEKYVFFAKPMDTGSMIPLSEGKYHGHNVLTYHTEKKETPVVFDKEGKFFRTSDGGSLVGEFDYHLGYPMNEKGFEFMIDEAKDGLVYNAEFLICPISAEQNRIMVVQFRSRDMEEGSCKKTQLYVRAVSDDELFSSSSGASSSVEALSISSKVPQPVSTSAVHESSSVARESSSVHVQNPASSNYVSSSSVAAISVAASSVASSSASASASSAPFEGDVCACMEASLECVVKPDADTSKFETIFANTCTDEGNCNPIDGIYAACSPAQKLGYVINGYYLSQKRDKDACFFEGVATIQDPSKIKQCKASGSNSAGSSAGSSASSGSASAGITSGSVSASASNSVVASSASVSSASSSASANSQSIEGDVCACMEAGLECVPKPDADPLRFAAVFNWACSDQGGVNCSFVNPEGIYGACSEAQRVGYVMNAYYLSQERNKDACFFEGVATIQIPATGQCSASASGSASGSAGSSASGSNSAPAASVANALVSGSAAASVAAGSASAAASVAPSQWNASTVTRESIETSTICTKCQAGESSLVTVWKTYTDYTTYCPSETTLTITKCDEKCHPSTVTVTSATTLTVTGKCIVPETTVASEHPVETGSSAHPVGSAAPEHPAEASVANKPVESGHGSNPSKPVDSGNGSAPGKPVQSSSAPKPINGKGNGNNNGDNVNNKPASGAPNPTKVSVASNPKSSSSSERDTTQTLTSSVTLRPVSSFDNGASKNGAFGALVLGFAALLL